MKLALFILVFVTMGLSAHGEEQTSTQTTQADWFSPSCPACAKLLTPGSANLGNTKGVFRPNGKKQKKKATTTEPVNVGQ